MVPSCTNEKSCICTTWIQWCRPVQTTTAVYVLHKFNGAVLYKRQELYMYYMDSMVPSCTNDKSCICTTWIKWCRPVQTTRAVYVLHGLNGAVLYKWQELYMYYNLYRTAPLNPWSTYTALVVCTGRHHWIYVVHILLLLFVQDGTIESM
jgi:hypothetical protein